MNFFNRTRCCIAATILAALTPYASIADSINVLNGETLDILNTEILSVDGVSSNDGTIVNNGYLANTGLFSNSGFLYNETQVFNSSAFISSGSINGNNLSSTFTNATGGTFTNTGSFSGNNIVNAGTWHYSANTSFANTLTNSGVFNVDSQLTINNHQIVNNSGVLTINSDINNLGVFNGQAGSTITNNSYIDNTNQFVVGGSFHNQINANIYNGYNSHFINNAVFTNDGAINGDNDTAVFSNAAGATFTNNGSLAGHNIVNAGTWHYSANTSFTNTLDNSGTLNINTQLDIANHQTVTNSGVLNNNTGITNNGIFKGQAGGSITNSAHIANQNQFIAGGTFHNESSANIYNGYNSQFTNNGVFVNDGSINGDNDTSTFTNAAAAIFTNNGTLQGNNIINAGTFHDYGNTSFTNTLSNAGEFNAHNLMSIASHQTVSNSGVFNNNAGITNNGVFNGQAGGSITNSAYIDNQNQFIAGGTFHNESSANIHNGYNSQFTNNGVFVNDGSINGDSDTSTFTNAAGGTFTNNGTLQGNNIINAGTWHYNSNTSFANTLVNTGVFNANTQLNIADHQTVTNSGSFNVDGGLFNFGTFNGQTSGVITNSSFVDNYSQFIAGGSFHNESGANIYNSSNSHFINNGEFINDGFIGGDNDTATFTNAAGGTITNNGSFQGNNIVNAGTWHYNGNTSFANTLANSGTLNVNTQLLDIANHQTVSNSGVFNINSGLNNFGVFNGQAAGSITNNSSLANINEFSTAGVLNNIAGATIDNTSTGTFVNAGVTTNDGSFVNHGTFIVAEGSIFNGDGSFSQFDGTTIVNGELTQNSISITGGAIQGNGNISSSSSFILIDGVAVNPGNSVGTLNFDGLTQFNSILNIEIESATSFDTIFFDDVIFGANSAINFLFEPGYNPLDGDLISFLFADSIANFNSINFSVLGLGAGLGYELVNDQTSIALLVTSTVPVPPSALLFGSGLFCIMLRRVLNPRLD